MVSYMRTTRYHWKTDRKGLEIAMNMVVSIIVAVAVLGVVLYFVTSIGKTVPKAAAAMDITPNQIKSVADISTGATTSVQIYVYDSDSKNPLAGAKFLFSGCGVKADTPAYPGDGKYTVNLKAHLGTTESTGTITVTVQFNDRPDGKGIITVTN